MHFKRILAAASLGAVLLVPAAHAAPSSVVIPSSLHSVTADEIPDICFAHQVRVASQALLTREPASTLWEHTVVMSVWGMTRPNPRQPIDHAVLSAKIDVFSIADQLAQREYCNTAGREKYQLMTDAPKRAVLEMAETMYRIFSEASQRVAAKRAQ